MYFVYKIENSVNGKYYIGVHKSNDPNDSYMGSGIAIKRAIKKYGIENFTKTILEEFDSADRAYSYEKMIVDPSSEMSYNMNTGGKGGWDYVNSLEIENPMYDPDIAKKVGDAVRKTRESNPEHYNEISRKNISKAHDARRGQKDTTETVQKRIDSLKEYYTNNDSLLKGITLDLERRQKLSNGWTKEKRKKKSEQQKKRIEDNPEFVKTNLGKKFTKETKDKMSDAAKEVWSARKTLVITCPHCNKTGSVNLKRWHFDNCKEKI